MDAAPDDRKYRNVVFTIVAAVCALAIIGFGVKSLMGGPASSKPKAPKISLLPATPPPPPKEERKPEPPKEHKEVRMEQPEIKQAPAPAPDNTLKMEGDKGSGPSDFQAGTVTRENYLSGSERGGSQYVYFSNLMQRFLQDELTRNKKLAGREYRVALNLWFDRSGKIEKVNLTQSSGNAETDTLIRGALAEIPALKTPLPDSIPQPVRLRVTSRGAG